MPEKLEDLVETFSSLAGQKQLSMPAIEMTENGQRVSNPRMDPSIMNFIMMASIASQAVKIRKYFDDRTSSGLIQSFNNLAVTDELREVKIDYPAQSFSLLNNGPNTVNVSVNTTHRPSKAIAINQTLNINFETHQLKYLYLQCDRGETASVEIVVKD